MNLWVMPGKKKKKKTASEQTKDLDRLFQMLWMSFYTFFPTPSFKLQAICAFGIPQRIFMFYVKVD